ncbi:MAG: SPOR domain-containing protein [Hyphomicrobiales bacterium]|nr:SPOR domain-containing protein [Hyphomicrobiales bacterium]
MLRIRTGARHGLRGGAFGIVAAVFAFSGHCVQAAPYSDIVVDANSGNVLHATSPDASRHPASLTKIMTLYLLFERLEAGKLNLDSVLKVSEFAAGQSPTKLGLKPGSSIQVEDAIKGIITRSANDAAVVVAEAIGGSEPAFAKLMTRKAQALGMSHTLYKNASGLPDDEQVTTARDQSTLGRAIQERFPRYYKYFSTRSFTFRGQAIGNHNHLLGRVEGVDGIKTGYIRASGFNLVTSVHRGNRYLVAVVMGGNSAASRDARMRDLISEKIALASTKRSTTMVAEATPPKPKPKLAGRTKPELKAEASKAEPTAEVRPESGFGLASAHSVPVRFTPTNEPAPRQDTSAARPLPGSTDPIRPVLVRTMTVRAGAQTASLTPPLMPAAAPAPSTEAAPMAMPAPYHPRALPVPPAVPARMEVAAAAPAPAAAPTARAPAPEPTVVSSPAPAITAAAATGPASAPAAAPAAPSAPVVKPQPRIGWMIQVGAYPAEQEAKQRLSIVQSKAAKMLNRADPFTETVDKGGTTLYRARFAGLDKDSAEAACKYLKRNDVDCVPIKN